MRELKFKLSDTTLVSDVNQTLSNLLSQVNKTNGVVRVVNSKVAVNTKAITALQSAPAATSSDDVDDNIPRPTTARFALWEASTTSGTWLATNDTFTSSTGPGGGSSSIAPTAAGGQATQGTNNVNWLGSRWIWPGRTITFLTTAIVVITATGQIYWGITSAGGGAVPTTADFIGVGISSIGSAAGNWLLLTSTGGAITSIDSGVAVTQSVRHDLKVTVIGGVASLYLDGLLIATNPTIPTANALSMTLVGKNSGGSGLAFTSEYAYTENSTL